MNLQWTEDGWLDYLYWQKNDLGILAKINELIKDINRNHYSGFVRESLRRVVEIIGY